VDASRYNAVWTREVRRWSSLTLEVEGIRRHAVDHLSEAQMSEWVKIARQRAKELVLRGTSKYDRFLWESFCREFGAKKQDKSSAG
jgi:hypothetical protein